MRFASILFLLLLPVAAHAAPAKPAPQKPLDILFGELAKAESPEDAKPIEDQIEGLFAQSGSPSVDLLMIRASAAQALEDTDTAKKILESVVAIAPNFAQGWYALAQIQSASGDDEGALVSLQKAVALNPRHFAALNDLGDMLAEYGDKPAALKMYRRALALDPQLEEAQRHERILARDVEGQGI
jgi:tetratricopeptide (TPR) repeat protein